MVSLGTLLTPFAALIATASASCTPQAPFDKAGIHSITVTHDGVERSAIVVTPDVLSTREKTPLILHFHGLGMTAGVLMDYSGMNEQAGDAGFFIVYPEGTVNVMGDEGYGGNSWNAGVVFPQPDEPLGCCGTAVNTEVDDIGFVTTLVNTLHTTICTDPKNTFATGFSNGAFMTYSLAYNTDLFRAIAPISGLFISLTTFGAKYANDIPTLHMHETGDQTVPIGGYGVGPSAVDLVEASAAAQDCTVLPTDEDAVETFNNRSATCTTATCPEGKNATFCQIVGTTHTWFGSVGATPPFNGTGDIDASVEVVKFFERYLYDADAGMSGLAGAGAAGASAAVLLASAINW